MQDTMYSVNQTNQGQNNPKQDKTNKGTGQTRWLKRTEFSFHTGQKKKQDEGGREMTMMIMKATT